MKIDLHFHWHAALLIADDATGYREARKQLIRRFEETDNWFNAYLVPQIAINP